MLKLKGYSAIVLAGGKSSRIGQDKGELFLIKEKVAYWTLKKITALFSEVIYATNYPNLAPKNYDIKVVTDEVPHLGPLGALASALPKITNPYAFVVAYDMPFIEPALINFLLSQAPGFDVVVPIVRGKLEPLFAVYHQHCLAYIKKELALKNQKLTGFFNQAQVKYVPETDIKKYDPELISFFNINTWEDFKKAQKLAQTL